MHRLVLATRNFHKAHEFSEILGSDFVVTDLSGLTEVPEVEETGTTFEENAILKALAASRLIEGAVVSDDSGLSVKALQGAPGIRSARYAGERATDQENISKLLSEMRATDDREASFHCAIALAEKGRIVRVFHGVVRGSIASEPRGERGFGYDSVFIPEGYAETFAELPAAVKNAISHRTDALSSFRAFLSDRRHSGV